MANFPSLTRRGSEVHNPTVREFDSGLAHDPTVRGGPSDGGYVTSRAKFTRMTHVWNVNYTWITAAQKVTLKTFIETTVVGGSLYFNWTNPEDSVVYVVRFLNPLNIKFVPHDSANLTFFSVNFTLEQV